MDQNTQTELKLWEVSFKKKFKMKETIKELTETGASSVQGTTVGTKYGLQPIQYLKEIVDAAKNNLYFLNFVKQVNLPKGNHDVTVPKKSTYEGRSGISFDTTERTAADISWTTLDNLASVIITPTVVLSGYALTKTAIHTNVLNVVDIAKEELSYGLADRVDSFIATTIGDATSTTSSATGAQTIYGGDATSDNTLSAGDTLTTELISEGAKLLQTVNKQYRASTGAGGGYGAISGTVTGNGWQNTKDDPFVLFLGPAQEKILRDSSQFTNAAEYGGNEVVQNGEIGQYLGIKIVVTNNVEQVASGSEGPDAETANAGATMTRCILMKGKKAFTFVWGRSPELNVWEYNERDQVRMSLVTHYSGSVIYGDAIVFIDVADA